MKDYHYRMTIEEAQVREQKRIDAEKKMMLDTKSNVMKDVLKKNIR